MTRLLTWVYQHIYIMYYRFWPGDTPHISALILTSGIVVIDLGLIGIVLLSKLGVSISPNKNAGLYAIAIYGVMLIVTYLVIVRPKVHKRLSNDFESKSVSEKRKLVINSIIFNLVILFWPGLVRHRRHFELDVDTLTCLV